MKTGRLGFGLFILIIGVAWLACSLGWQPTGWSAVLPYWPIVLILWGVSIMVRQPAIRALTLTVAAIFAAVWVVSWFDPGTLSGEASDQSLSVTADSQVTSGSLRFDSGAGQFQIQEQTEGDDLLTVSSSALRGVYKLDQSISDSELTARVWYDQQWGRPMIGLMGGWHNEATIGLNSDVVWQLSVNVGASEFALNADQLQIEQATISAGAADISIKLGDRLAQSDLTVKAGASDITVLVPNTVGVRAELSTGLTGHDLADLVEQSEGVWESTDYETADYKIDLHFETGVSDIKLDRY